MKKLFYYIGILVLLAFVTITVVQYVPISVMAEETYTEEEKAQAKAWLSAHGYPPTREGAAQAYQDYLDGKFDDDPDIQAAARENNITTQDRTNQAKITQEVTTTENITVTDDTEDWSEKDNTQSTTLETDTSNQSTAKNPSKNGSTEQIATEDAISVEDDLLDTYGVKREEKFSWKEAYLIGGELIIVLLMLYRMLRQ